MKTEASWSVWLVILLLALAGPALAQDQEGSASDENEKAEEGETYENTMVVVMEVVSASKREEKLMEAPSTVEKVDELAILYSPATTYSGALAQVKGIDFANGGINLQKISTRGFSSSFNSRMLSLIDGRLSTMPGAGLPQGGLSSVSSLDIKSMELVLGPAGALYGSNTTAGVLNVITKDAWDETGLALSARGGEQNLMDLKFRYAGNVGDTGFGWKINGEYMDADEFDSDNIFTLAGQNQTSFGSYADAENAVTAGLAYHEEDLVDEFTVTSQKYDLTGYYKTDYMTLSLNHGWSENDGFGVTNLGRNRIKGWEIETYQFRASAEHWFFNVTYTDEVSGETYAINSVPGYLAAGMTRDQAAAAARFVNESSLIDYEFQANYEFGNLFVIAGGQYREYDPNSKGSYLDDVDALGNPVDISRDETGLYAQMDYRMMNENLRFVVAGRYDDFSEFDSQFSPKFGVTYRHKQHFFRANYMTSYRAPEIIENHLMFAGGAARGNLSGYEVYLSNPSGADTLIATYPGLQPEEVDTMEVGYRGILGDRVALDFVAYQSDYENFISPLQIIAHPAYGTYAVAADGEIIPFLLTYFNYGAADLYGWDLGLDFYISPKAVIHSSVGYSKLDSFDNDSTIADIPFNTPEWKFKADLTLKDLGWDGFFLTLGGRHVDEYEYLSGNWNGIVEANTIFDMAAGYSIPDQNLVFKVSASNVTDSDKTELLGASAIPRFITAEVYKRF